MNDDVKARQPPFAAFFALAFGISWLALLPAAAAEFGVVGLEPPALLLLLSGFGPALAAIIVVSLRHGWAGLGEFLGRLLIWRVAPIWYLVVLLGPAAILLVAIGLNRLLGGEPPPLGVAAAAAALGSAAEGVSLGLLVPAVFLVQALTLLGEELGWRGYALPALQARVNALAAGVILGVFWGVWHLPLALIPATRAAILEIPFSWFMLDIIAMSILYVWIYNNTRGSLLIALLLHVANNTAGIFLGVAFLAESGILPFALVVGVRWLVAIIVIFVAGPQHLSRVGAERNPYYDRVVTGWHTYRATMRGR